MVGRSTNQKMPRVLQLPSGSPTLHLGMTIALALTIASNMATRFVHEIDLCEIFECAHLKFTVCGRKQASTYVNTLPQCNPASVGLAHAHPSKASQLLRIDFRLNKISMCDCCLHLSCVGAKKKCKVLERHRSVF